ncbi:MAG: hypothetical protein FK734_01175 [Asgard group archaeon]|nr:hypothetical protein [Asgard group archaeon]
MFTPYIPRPQGLFGQEGYCYGWATIEDFFGETVIHHGGSTGVSSAFLALIPKKKLGIIILGNVSNSLGGLLSQLFFASFLGKNPQTDHPVLKLENKLSALPGEYQNYKGIAKLYITKKGTTLFGGMKEGEIDYPLIPETNEPDDYRFWIPMSGTKFPVEFMINQETGMIDLFIERNRYHKVSPIKKQPKKKEN